MNISALIVEKQFTFSHDTITAISNLFDVVGHLRWIPDDDTLNRVTNPDILIACIAGQPGFAKDLTTIKAFFPDSKIVVIANVYDQLEMNEALAVGAGAYLMSELATTALLGALMLAATEDVVLLAGRQLDSSAIVPPDQAERLSVTPGAAELSPRETTILELVKGGDSNKHIARKLGIAEATVKCHVKAILRKINVRNRFDAAMWALRVDEIERQRKNAPVQDAHRETPFERAACARSNLAVGIHGAG